MLAPLTAGLPRQRPPVIVKVGNFQNKADSFLKSVIAHFLATTRPPSRSSCLEGSSIANGLHIANAIREQNRASGLSSAGSRM